MFRMYAVLFLALFATVGLVGCADNPADDVPAAQVSEQQAANAPAEEMADDSAENGMAEEADESEADMNADDDAAADDDMAVPGGEVLLTGTVSAKGSNVSRTHELSFGEWSGTASLGDGTPESASIQFEVTTGSVVTDPDSRGAMSDRLDGHLKSEDFFASDEYPTASFVSTSIVEGGEGDATHTITGDFTIRGVTKEIAFPATVAVDGDTVTARAEFSLNRQDFGVSYPGQPDDLIRDDVVIVVDVTGQA